MNIYLYSKVIFVALLSKKKRLYLCTFQGCIENIKKPTQPIVNYYRPIINFYTVIEVD